jgi:hypothetical protein
MESGRLQDAERHAADWLSQHRALVPEQAIFDRLVKSRVGSGIAWFYPAADFTKVALITELYLWLMSYDRFSGEAAGTGDCRATARALGQVVRVLDRPQPLGDGAAEHERAAADIAIRIDREFHPESAARVIRAVRDLLFAKLWESAVCAAGNLPDLADYLVMRRHTVFGVLSVECIEAAGGFVLPAVVRADPRIRRLAEAVCNLIAWHNDLRSFSFEQAASAAPPASLPTLIARRDGSGLDEAFGTVTQMITDESAAARALIAELPADQHRETGLFTDGAGIFISQTDNWHRDNPRYQVRDATQKAATTGS